MIKIWDKYKIKSKYKKDILKSLKMWYDNIDDNIVNKIWIIDDIDEIYKNKDLSYFDLDDVMFSFKCWNIRIWINLSEIKEYKEKIKTVRNQEKFIF